MNASSWQTVWLLAVEVAAVVALTLLIAWRLRSVVWQRTLWQASLLALVGLLVVEFAALFPEQSPKQIDPVMEARTEALEVQPAVMDVPTTATELSIGTAPLLEPMPIITEPAGEVAEVKADAAVMEPSVVAPLVVPEEKAGFPLALAIALGVWVVGALVLASRLLVGRFLLLRFCSRSRSVYDVRLFDRVQGIAGKLGLKQTVQVLETERIQTPVVFGLVRLTIALPMGFAEKFERRQQEAILAHELAHLAARDPLWYLLADALVSVLWWHPLVWVARARLQVTSEMAADEACVLAKHGPETLAECLVTIAQEMHGRGALESIGIEGSGFRSRLGQRVERLLKLSAEAVSRPAAWRTRLVKVGMPVLLVGVLLMASGWVRRDQSTPWSGMLGGAWSLMTGLLHVEEANIRRDARPQLVAVLPEPVIEEKPVLRVAAKLSGRVVLGIKPIPERELPVTGEVAKFARKPLTTRFFVVDENGGLGDAVVYIKRGLEGRQFNPPTEPKIFTARGMEWHPFVGAVQTGQPVRFTTEDPVAINLHFVPNNRSNKEWNKASLPVNVKIEHPEVMARLKTDVYPWMFAYISAFEHPYFAVTDAKGSFDFQEELLPGRYVVAVRHRMGGEVEQEIEVGASGGGQVMFTLPDDEAREKFKRAEEERKRFDVEKKRYEAEVAQAKAEGKAFNRLFDIRHVVPSSIGPAILAAFTDKRSKVIANDKSRSLLVTAVEGDMNKAEEVIREQDVEQKLQTGPKGGVSATAEEQSRLDGIKPGKRELNEETEMKLDELVLPELSIDGLPLAAALQQLMDESKRLDPTGKGLQFNHGGTLSGKIKLEMGAGGNPVWAKPGGNIMQRMENVVVTVKPPRKGLSFRQALEAICSGTSLPTRFVNQNGVVFVSVILNEAETRLAMNGAPILVGKRELNEETVKRLENVKLPEMFMDGLPLEITLQFLMEESVKRDPEKKGFKMVARGNVPFIPAPDRRPVLNASGLPVIPPDAHESSLDRPLEEILILVNPVKNNLNFKQAIEAVCEGSLWPLTYQIEDGVIVFTAKLMAKLDAIKLKRTTLNRMPMIEVVRYLNEASQKLAEGKQGVKFGVEGKFQLARGGVKDAEMTLVTREIPEGTTLRQAMELVRAGAEDAIEYEEKEDEVVFRPKKGVEPLKAPVSAGVSREIMIRVQGKLTSVIIPKLQFKRVLLEDALAALAQQAKAADLEGDGLVLKADPELTRLLNSEPMVVTIDPPLLNLQLGDALEAVTLAAQNNSRNRLKREYFEGGIHVLLNQAFSSSWRRVYQVDMVKLIGVLEQGAGRKLDPPWNEARARFPGERGLWIAKMRELVQEYLQKQHLIFSRNKEGMLLPVVMVNDRLGMVAVTGELEQLEQVEKLIAPTRLVAMKQEPSSLEPLVSQIFTLKHAMPTEIATAVHTASTDSRSRILADDRAKKLLVTVVKGDMKNVEEIIAKLDVVGKDTQAEVKSKIQKEKEIFILIQDGKLLYELRRLEEAEAKLREAIKIDPANTNAFYYMNLIQEARYGDLVKKRDAEQRARIVEVEKNWEVPKARDVLPTPNPYVRTNAAQTTTKSRQRIMAKLDQMVIKEMHFDGVPLVEVVRFLQEESVKQDPDKLGINFIINSNLDDQPSSRRDSTRDPLGAPLAPAPGAIDLDSMLIKINPPLRNLRMIDALDVITKSATPIDGKGLSFMVEDYAVVFRQRVVDPKQMFTRVWSVDKDKLIQGLENQTGQKVMPLTTNVTIVGPTNLLQSVTTPGEKLVTKDNSEGRMQQVSSMARQFFAARGVNLNTNKTGEASTQIFFNDRTGVLMARASLADLEVIHQCLEVIGAGAAAEVRVPAGADMAVGVSWAYKFDSAIYVRGLEKLTGRKVDELTAAALAERPNGGKKPSVTDFHRAKWQQVYLLTREFLMAQGEDPSGGRFELVSPENPDEQEMRWVVRAAIWNSEIFRKCSEQIKEAGKEKGAVVPVGTAKNRIATGTSQTNRVNVLMPSAAEIKEVLAQTNQVSQLVQDGKRLYELRRLKEAQEKLQEAATLEPGNKVVYYFANIVREALMGESDRVLKGIQQQDAQHKAGVFPTMTTNQQTNDERITKVFKVEPNQLAYGLREKGFMKGTVSGVSNTNIEQALTRYLSRELHLVVNSNGANGVTVVWEADSKQVVARGGLRDLEVIESAMEVLNIIPAQVQVEVRYIEVSDKAAKEMGLNWFTSGPLSETNRVKADQFLNRTIPTNQNVRVEAPVLPNYVSVLSPAQAKALIKQFETTTGIDLLTAPKVTTVSNREAMIAVENDLEVMVGVQTNQTAGARKTGEKQEPSYIKSPVKTGPTLDVLPKVQADGKTLQVTWAVCLTQFVGYDKPEKGREAEGPLPRFRVRQVANTNVLRDGQTLLVGCGTAVDKVAQKRGLFSSVPKTETRHVIVMLTPRIIDPSGNFINHDKELGY